MSETESTRKAVQEAVPTAGAFVDREMTRPTTVVGTTLDDAWLHDFYKECGREVTLAYTTLNQMKNWAIAVQAAIIAAVVSFGRSLLSHPDGTVQVPLGFAVVVGAVLAYLFTLRFFVRAILCYVNLLRWNTLQSVIVKYKLVPRDRGDSAPLDKEQLENCVRSHIQDYYHRWLSPVPRRAQIASNLKLGFGLLLALPALLLMWGASAQWDNSLVRGLVAFAIGGTFIEVMDFWASRFFDTPAVAASRREEHYIFPAPSGDLWYVAIWLLNVTLSGFVALWPWLRPAMYLTFCRE
jgi:hypothetical protein